MLASLLAAMYPALLDATGAEIAAAALALRAPAARGKRAFERARKLWFLPATGPREVCVSRIVMRGLAEAFGENPGDPEAPVDVLRMALHLCVGNTPEEGAAKAMVVASYLSTTSGEGGEKEKASAGEATDEKQPAVEAPEGEGAEDGGARSEDSDSVRPREGELAPVDRSSRDAKRRFAKIAGPGAMSPEAAELLKLRDLEGKDVDVPAIEMVVADHGDPAKPLLGIRTAKWFKRYGFVDCLAVVQR